uniref:4-hydroxythreonine-4-phosphate dehydrogenase PdxA n=1 Tax=candidate division WOR-3 bacterium TaxID=2052148 RepID=A0A7C4CB61_UNCW3
MTRRVRGFKRAQVGITMGDPAGIGPEIVLRALDRMPRLRPRIIGARSVFARLQCRLGTGVDLNLVDDSVPAPGRFRMGEAQTVCGRAALAALENGVGLLREGRVSALVTAPVSKEALRLAGFGWPGQTEFLAERLGARHHAMLAWTPRFKVIFVTIHVPLAHVSRHITARAVAEKVRLLDDFLRREGKRRPRICVMALNPHAHEFTLGEERRIGRGVELARRAGVVAVGPVPAEIQLVSVFTAGICARTKIPAAAQSLLDFLKTPAAAAALRSAGLEPA